ncbi:MAG: LytTR family DNA-binding domain-containing protein [Acidobacteriota bacterium]
MNVFLVDDEPLALKRLARMIEESGRARVAGSAQDPEAALAAMQAAPPDAVFLDIEMPGLTGFELLASMTAPPLVVFTTAYHQYALQAFEANSIDYLLKPVSPEALDRAFNKLDRMLGGAAPRGDFARLLSQVQQALAQPAPSYPTRIASKLGDKVEFVDLAQVTHFYAKDKLTFAATAAKHYVVDPTIAELESRLDPQQWLRIHRSTLLHIEHVKEIHTWFGGRVMVRMKDGKTELQVARDRTAVLKEKLGI